ncbi:MAG: type VI secretion system membrane subunit TssM [Polyangiaceae bacterium]
MIWFWLLALFIVVGTWVGGFFLGWALWLKILLTVFAAMIVGGAYLGRRIRASMRDKALERELLKQAEQQALNARPDRRAEIAQLQVQFQRGIQSLRQSRLGGGKQTALYALPWYMLIGPPGAGKTTALRHSGLPFPVLDGDGKGLRGIGGTRNCDWWFTNEAILLDTAGRYATESDDHDEWTAFLDLLKRYRPAKPVNGVIVSISITDLLEANEEQIDAYARRLRARIDEVMSRLQMVVPVYVALTKIDLVEGFVEFWNDLRKSERQQIWGMTFPLAGSEERDAAKAFHEEFERLVATLHSRAVRRLAQERNPDARTRIFQFPAEFRSIEPNVSEFLSSLFQKNQFSETPIFRGVYFTSGTQEGRPLSRVVSGMLRAFNLGAAPATPDAAPTEAKSYFLTDVFRRVVFPDQNVAARTAGELKRQLVQRIGFAAAAFLLAMMVLLPSSCTFMRNRELVDTSEKLALDASKVNWADTNLSVVDKARRLDDMRGQLKQLDDWNREGAPIAYRWGMYTGESLYEPLRSVYVANLQTAFAIPTKARLEDELRGVGEGGGLTTDQYNTHFSRLRAYLEACDLEHLENEWEPPALTDAWGRALGANQKADKEILKNHVAYYVELMKRKEIPLWHCDTNLVNRVRSVLRRLSQADRDYSALVRDANENVAPISRDTVFLNTAFGSYVTSKSKPEIVVPGAFTKLGWELYVRDRLGKDRARQLAADRWVLGDNQAISVEQMERLLKEVRDRYFANFNIAWSDFIKDLEVRKPESNTDALEELSALSEVPWPYLRLTRILHENVTLEESKADQALNQVEKGLIQEGNRALQQNQTVQTAERILGIDGGAPIQAPKRWVSPPELAFKPMTEFGIPQGLANGQEPTPQQAAQTRLAHYQDRIIAKLVAVLTDLRDSKGRGIDAKAVTAAFEDAIRGSNELLTGSQSGFTRPLLSPLLLNPIEMSYGGVLSDQGGTFSGNWELDVWRKWHERLEDGYPFTDTWKDVALEDYTEFFKPNGMLFGFYEKNLKGAMELQGSHFLPTTRFNQAIAFTAPFLKCYDRGLEFQKATFPDGADKPTVEFEINLHSVSDNVAEVTFDIDGSARTYKNEPEEWLKVNWPAAKKEAAGARVRIRGFSGLFEEIARPGEWGLYRLLDSATKIEPGTLGGKAGATPTMVATWNLRSQNAVVKMDIRPSKRDSVFPPYVTKKERMFRSYDCPRLIYRGVKGR